jgi:hypothetical protein
MVVTRNTCQARNQPADGNHRPNLKLNHQCSYLQVRSSTWRLLSKYCLVWWPQDRQNLQFCQSWKNCLVGPVPSRGSLTRRRRYHLRQLPQSRYPGAATVLGFISTRTVQNSGGIRETTRGPRPQRNPAVAPWARGEPAINAVNHGDANLPRVSINIEGKEVVALIDTEATHNMIRRRTVTVQVKLLDQ